MNGGRSLLYKAAGCSDVSNDRTILKLLTYLAGVCFNRSSDLEIATLNFFMVEVLQPLNEIIQHPTIIVNDFIKF
ncbi:MAG: hypothetical protein EAZ19_06285 [Oscillatoriales cyanobacterium]|nr:MAG: hypothetical protein EAZ19_06285 [Oscillatoriales cyanobacterium]